MNHSNDRSKDTSAFDSSTGKWIEMYSSELLHFKLGKQENSDEKLKQAKYNVNNT